MSVEELRVLFTLAADAQQRIKNFRSERIATIVAGQGPVLLPANSRLIVHLVPLSAFGHSIQIDLERAYQIRQQFCPMGADGMRPRFNLDGFINVRGGDERPGYTQVFRNGIVEATQANILSECRGAATLPAELTTDILEVLPSYFKGLRTLDVPPPIVLMVSCQGVVGAKLGIHVYNSRFDRIEPFPHVEPLLLPEGIVDDYGSLQDYARALMPTFDALWNAAGFARCTCYDADGNWRPSR